MGKYKLGEWLVSPSDCTITKNDTVVTIEPKAMELLSLLAKANGELVTRQAIMEEVWQGRYVSDYAVNNIVSSLRKYLNKDDSNAYIKTRPKLGYQLSQKVEPLVDSDEEHANNLFSKTRMMYASMVGIVLVLIGLVVFELPISTSLQDKENSIAVLPLSLLADSNEIEYFADGLSEEIIHQLTTLPEFRVISRTSSSVYKDTVLSSTEIANKLGVNYLLQGAVRQEKELLKVSIQLIDASIENVLWSQNFTANIDNAFVIQQQISEQVSATLGGGLSLTNSATLRFRPTSGEAYLHLLRGRKYNQTRTPDSLLRARDEFLMATLLEPDYAEAFVNLAVSYLLMAQNKMLTTEEANQETTQALTSALNANPLLPEAYAAKGILAYNNNNVEEAKLAFEKALELNDDLYLALINYGNLLRTNYRKIDALPYYEKALDVAPLSSAANWGIGSILIGLGRFDEAIDRYRTCVYRLPSDMNCHLGLAYVLRLSNKPTQANVAFGELDALGFSQDYYYRMASAWHYLWKDQANNAEVYYEALLAQFGFDIDALQSITLTKYRLGKQADWLARIETEYDPIESGLAVKANYAHAAYFNDRCDIAVPLYEEIFLSYPNVFEDADILANGISYPAMLAYCYDQQGNFTGKEEMMQLYTKMLNALPDNINTIPGFVHAGLKYHVLANEPIEADQKLQVLNESNWSLSWLIDKDPLLTQAE